MISGLRVNIALSMAGAIVGEFIASDRGLGRMIVYAGTVFDLKLVSNQCPAEGNYWGEMVELPDGLSGVLKIDFEANKRILKAVLNGEERNTTIQ